MTSTNEISDQTIEDFEKGEMCSLQRVLVAAGDDKELVEKLAEDAGYTTDYVFNPANYVSVDHTDTVDFTDGKNYSLGLLLEQLQDDENGDRRGAVLALIAAAGFDTDVVLKAAGLI